jgi:hypothetical protein
MALARLTRIDTSSRVAAPQTKLPQSRIFGKFEAAGSEVAENGAVSTGRCNII